MVLESFRLEVHLPALLNQLLAPTASEAARTSTRLLAQRNFMMEWKAFERMQMPNYC